MPTLFFCKKCHYAFPSPSAPSACPDCGSDAVREATESEETEYKLIQEQLQNEIEEEIRE